MHSFAPAAPAMQQAMATRSMSVQMQSKEELAAALNPAIGYFDPLGLGTADFWTQGNECAAPYGIAPGSRGRWRRRSQRHEATQPTLRYARTRRRVPLVAPPLCVASAPSPHRARAVALLAGPPMASCARRRSNTAASRVRAALPTDAAVQTLTARRAPPAGALSPPPPRRALSGREARGGACDSSARLPLHEAAVAWLWGRRGGMPLPP